MVENTSTPSRAWNSKHVAMDLPDLKETYISFHLSRDPPVETRREKRPNPWGRPKNSWRRNVLTQVVPTGKAAHNRTRWMVVVRGVCFS